MKFDTNAVAQSIHDHYMTETPPPTHVIVYKDGIKPLEALSDDEDVVGWYQATVKLVSNFVSSKVHKVHIKFQLNKRSRLIPDTIGFLF